MRAHSLLWLLGTVVQGLNILITVSGYCPWLVKRSIPWRLANPMQNDDGFASANTRELYKELTALGHSCYVVAPPTDQSDVNECDLFTSSPVLLSNSQWGAPLHPHTA